METRLNLESIGWQLQGQMQFIETIEMLLEINLRDIQKLKNSKIMQLNKKISKIIKKTKKMTLNLINMHFSMFHFIVVLVFHLH